MKIFTFPNGRSNNFMKNCTRFRNYFAPIVIQWSVTTAWECLCHNQWGKNTQVKIVTLKRP